MKHKIRNINNSKVELPNVVGNAKGDQIPDMWRVHYESVFNCVQDSNCMNKLNVLKSQCILPSRDITVSTDEVYDIIKGLTNGKACGPDGISSEHLKYAGYKLPYLLSILCTSIFMHGCLPKQLAGSVIVPILKDKNKRLGDKTNYRPICLSNIL